MFVAAFHLRARSLLRGNLVVLGSLFLALVIARFPHNRPTLFLIFPAAAAFYGMYDTLRCLGRRWSMYHAGVLLCVYMDILSLTMILFLLLYPYMQWISN
jgi:hypothetical protein